MPDEGYQGLLCIGDPHLASRNPGFRRDDYPETVLGKLAFALDLAERQRLLPVLLGDLFHYPRDNANWLLVRLLDLLRGRVVAVAGNHDCSENALTPDDTLTVLWAAGNVRLLDRTGPWRGAMNGIEVALGGTPWGQRLPTSFDRDGARLVFWVAHHDIRFPGYEEAGRLGCREIPGVDVLINGHIHRPLEDVVCGSTTWLNPGNIARVSRSDGNRLRRPSVLRIDVGPSAGPAGWGRSVVELPHRPFEEVFHPEVTDPSVAAVGEESAFVRGLAQLESLKTSGGAGLRAFLDANLGQFEPAVAQEVLALAEEVIEDADTDA